MDAGEPMSTCSELTYQGQPALSAWTLSPDVLHLNHGSFGAVPTKVQAEQNRLRAEMDADPVAWFSFLPDRVARSREEMAAFLKVPSETLAYVNNASAGATAVFNSQPYQAGGNVLVTDHGYGAVSMGARKLATRWGGQLVTAHVPLAAGPEEAAESVIARMDEQTRLIVIDQITSSTGRGMPALQVADAARERGIPVLVDGAHVAGLYNEWIDCGPWDYWIGNFHKFSCSPRGAAVLIKNPDAQHPVYPLIDSWGAEMPFPESFDRQGTLDVTSYLCALSGWRFIDQEWGWDRVLKHMDDMCDYAEETIGTAFAEMTGESHKVDNGQPVHGLRLIRLPDGLAWDHDSADGLRDRFIAATGSEVAFTEFEGTGFLRVSAHAYTTRAQIDEFTERYVPLLLQWSKENQ